MQAIKFHKPKLDVIAIADIVVVIVIIALIVYLAILTDGVLVYTAVIGGSAIVSAPYHYGVSSLRIASLLSAVTVDAIAFIGDVIWRGQVDIWWLIVAFGIGLMAFVTSLAVGVVMDSLGLSKRSRPQTNP